MNRRVLADTRGGGAAPTLVVIRGNSGSGKTTTAREVRRRYGRGCALIEQDQERRIVLREHDSGRSDPVAPIFITDGVRSALRLGYHVILEGILHSDRYGEPLRELMAEHDGPARAFYFDLSLEETLRRHRGRPEPVSFTEDDVRGWYSPRDLLGVPGEHVLDAAGSLEVNIATILHLSGLGAASPLTPCPTRCPHCAEEAAAAPT